MTVTLQRWGWVSTRVGDVPRLRPKRRQHGILCKRHDVALANTKLQDSWLQAGLCKDSTELAALLVGDNKEQHAESNPGE